MRAARPRTATGFAQRAGVVARGPVAETLVEARVVSGPLGIVDMTIEGTVAPDVAVVVSPDVPAGTDGVLGLSALWLFETNVAEDGTLKLSGTSAN